jgi:hypothetical protein
VCGVKFLLFQLSEFRTTEPNFERTNCQGYLYNFLPEPYSLGAGAVTGMSLTGGPSQDTFLFNLGTTDGVNSAFSRGNVVTSLGHRDISYYYALTCLIVPSSMMTCHVLPPSVDMSGF